MINHLYLWLIIILSRFPKIVDDLWRFCWTFLGSSGTYPGVQNRSLGATFVKFWKSSKFGPKVPRAHRAHGPRPLGPIGPIRSHAVAWVRDRPGPSNCMAAYGPYGPQGPWTMGPMGPRGLGPIFFLTYICLIHLFILFIYLIYV